MLVHGLGRSPISNSALPAPASIKQWIKYAVGVHGDVTGLFGLNCRIKDATKLLACSTLRLVVIISLGCSLMPLCNGTRARYDNVEDIDDLVCVWQAGTHGASRAIHDCRCWKSRLVEPVTKLLIMEPVITL